jgi:hypothetical protein
VSRYDYGAAASYDAWKTRSDFDERVGLLEEEEEEQGCPQERWCVRMHARLVAEGWAAAAAELEALRRWKKGQQRG